MVANPAFPVSEWSVPDLAAACRDETGGFLRHEGRSTGYCHELCRRAIYERDNQAWTAIIDQYRGLVLAWVRRHPVWPQVRTLSDDDTYWTNGVFVRFSAIKRENFAKFKNIAGLMAYLKRCAHTFLLDERDRMEPPGVVPLPDDELEGDASLDPANEVIEHHARQALWREVLTETQDEAERAVARLCLALEVKPAEVQHLRPDLFATADDVSRVKRNLLDRLKRNPSINALR